MELSENILTDFSVLDNYFPSASTSDDASIIFHVWTDDTTDRPRNGVEGVNNARKRKTSSKVHSKGNSERKKSKNYSDQPSVAKSEKSTLNEKQEEFLEKSKSDTLYEIGSMIMPEYNWDGNKENDQLIILLEINNRIRQIKKRLQSISDKTNQKKKENQELKLEISSELNNIQSHNVVNTDSNQVESTQVMNTDLNQVESTQVMNTDLNQVESTQIINTDLNQVESTQIINTDLNQVESTQVMNTDLNQVESTQIINTDLNQVESTQVMNTDLNQVESTQVMISDLTHVQYPQGMNIPFNQVQFPQVMNPALNHVKSPQIMNTNLQFPHVVNTDLNQVQFPHVMNNALNQKNFPHVVNTDLNQVQFPHVMNNALNQINFPHVVNTDLNQVQFPQVISTDLNQVLSLNRNITGLNEFNFPQVMNTYLNQVQFPHAVYIDMLRFQNPYAHRVYSPSVNGSPNVLSTDHYKLHSNGTAEIHQRSTNTAFNNQQNPTSYLMRTPTYLPVSQNQISGTSLTLQKLDNIQPVQTNKTSDMPLLRKLLSTPIASYNNKNEGCGSSSYHAPEMKYCRNELGTMKTINQPIVIQQSGITSLRSVHHSDYVQSVRSDNFRTPQDNQYSESGKNAKAYEIERSQGVQNDQSLLSSVQSTECGQNGVVDSIDPPHAVQHTNNQPNILDSSQHVQSIECGQHVGSDNKETAEDTVDYDSIIEELTSINNIYNPHVSSQSNADPRSIGGINSSLNDSILSAVHYTSTLNNSTITDVENCSTPITSSIPAVDNHHQFYQHTHMETHLLQDSENSVMPSIPAQIDSISTSNSAPVNQQNVHTEQLSGSDILSPQLIVGNLSDEDSSISRYSFIELLNLPSDEFKKLLTTEEEEEANSEVSNMSWYSSSTDYPDFLLSPTK